MYVVNNHKRRYRLHSHKTFVEEKTGLRDFVGDGKRRLLGFQKRQSRGRRNMYIYEFEENLYPRKTENREHMVA
ncbi:hypothetical protein YC2023_012999 [Brassica napus]